jgi:hypothetical protein
MATIVVTRNGKPVEGVEVEVKATFGFTQYNGRKDTDRRGEAEFEDNENRFYVIVNGQCKETVKKLRGTIQIEL